jgi:hypothetical protein
MTEMRIVMSELLPASGSDDVWEDLVVSILAVNQYSLEKTYAIVGGLREAGLASPQNLGAWEIDRIVSRLKSAGCDRGAFMTPLFAARLSSLGKVVGARGMSACADILAGKDFEEIRRLLLPVNGIGPKVMRNFCLLRGIDFPPRLGTE